VAGKDEAQHGYEEPSAYAHAAGYSGHEQIPK